MEKEPIASKICINPFVSVDSKFKRDSELYYKMRLKSFDFTDNLDDAIRLINDYIQAATNGRIRDMVDANDVDSDTEFFVPSAFFMDVKFDQPFHKGRTVTKPFYTENGVVKQVNMMNAALYDRNVRLITTSTFQFARFKVADYELYRKTQFQEMSSYDFFVILPKPEYSLNEIIQRFASDAHLFSKLDDPSTFGKHTRKLHPSINVEIPRFAVESKLNLSTFKDELGLAAIFNRTTANWGRLQSATFAKLKDITHAAVIEVHEEQRNVTSLYPSVILYPQRLTGADCRQHVPSFAFENMNWCLFSIVLVIVYCGQGCHGWHIVPSPEGRVFNGEFGDYGRVPELVLIEGNGAFCGGALLTYNYVVTACHCAVHIEEVGDATVGAGVKTLLNQQYVELAKVDITSIRTTSTCREEMNSGSQIVNEDVAVFKLDRPFKPFKNHISTAAIPDASSDTASVGSPYEFCGAGITEKSSEGHGTVKCYCCSV
ncbi:hypothetical protein QR680_004294 [Steinernema hermaphroditum]|uniref:Serpin domain-containing protein n=1 Tax=Steinernema hermaphroditum TaxID=289476 RepID=A0AA39HN82_9BILA|nr:hypothetical protein QR680_004294 [Steinernema hermaphroditum]